MNNYAFLHYSGFPVVLLAALFFIDSIEFGYTLVITHGMKEKMKSLTFHVCPLNIVHLSPASKSPAVLFLQRLFATWPTLPVISMAINTNI